MIFKWTVYYLLKWIKFSVKKKQQGCIPVGCVPATHWPYAGVCFLGGCLLQGGVCSQGVSAPGGVLWGGGVCSWGCVSAPVGVYVCSGGVCIPACTEADTSPVNRITDASKNITLGPNFIAAGKYLKNTGKLETITGKVRESCQSWKVGTTSPKTKHGNSFAYSVNLLKEEKNNGKIAFIVILLTYSQKCLSIKITRTSWHFGYQWTMSLSASHIYGFGRLWILVRGWGHTVWHYELMYLFVVLVVGHGLYLRLQLGGGIRRTTTGSTRSRNTSDEYASAKHASWWRRRKLSLISNAYRTNKVRNSKKKVQRITHIQHIFSWSQTNGSNCFKDTRKEINKLPKELDII